MKSKKALWAGLIVAVIMCIVWESVPLKDASERVYSLPIRGLNYAGIDIPVSPGERANYKAVRVLKRYYRIGKEEVVVVVIDGSKDRHVVHDPLYCFRGDGWQVASSTDRPVVGGVVKFLQLSKSGGKTAEAMYWMSDGKHRYTSAPMYWWKSTLRRLTLGASGDESVLVILQPLAGKTVDWNFLLDQFPALLDL